MYSNLDLKTRLEQHKCILQTSHAVSYRFLNVHDCKNRVKLVGDYLVFAAYFGSLYVFIFHLT